MVNPLHLLEIDQVLSDDQLRAPRGHFRVVLFAYGLDQEWKNHYKGDPDSLNKALELAQDLDVDDDDGSIIHADGNAFVDIYDPEGNKYDWGEKSF